MMSQQTIAQYTLLNDNGVPQDAYYIEVREWPNEQSNVGYAVYVDEDGTRDELSFTLDVKNKVLITHHIRAPKHKFMITPVVRDGEVVELRMDLGQNDIATFVLHPEDYITPEYDEELICETHIEKVIF